MKATQSARIFGCATALALGLTGTLPPQALADDHRAHEAHSNWHANKDKEQATGLVRAVREATRRYRDVRIAEAEGYHLTFGCVTGPDVGAMGLHFANMPLIADGILDPSRPEIILYEPLPNGRLRLTGADFLVPAALWDQTHDAPPQLMGHLLQYFPSPNRFGLPAFYTLHVWAWKDNRLGTFVNWHPRVSCDEFDGQAR